MKKFYKTDWFLRVVSVFVSIILWIYVVYFQNPGYERWIRDIPVVKTNESSDFENGKLCIVDGNSDTVDLKIKGSRKTVAKLTNQNIQISADMFGISSEGEYVLNTNVVFPVSGIEILQKNPHNFAVVVDKVITIEKKINVEYVGSLQEGYILENVEVSPQQIKITGPESIVGLVDKAVITVNLANNKKDIEDSFHVKLVGNGIELSGLDITRNIELADVKIKVYAQKSVDVNVKANNTDASLSYVAEQVKIKGSPDVLENLKSISTKPFDASHYAQGSEFEVELDLPDDVELISSDDNKITVTVSNKQ